jgi:Flp pilus assembly CpaF family ATPase
MNATLVESIRADVAERLADEVKAGPAGRVPRTEADRSAYGAQLVSEALEAHARDCVAAGRAVLDAAEEDALAQAVHDALFGLGRLQHLLDDDGIENIDANGADNVWVRLADGSRHRVEPIAADDAELEALIRTAAARLGVSERRFDLGSPALNLQLPDGSRLFALMGGTVVARPSLSVRRHRHQAVTLDDLVVLGTIDTALREFCAAAVAARLNLIVCGGTGVGKTTTLRALASQIDPRERLVTIEDSFELGLDRTGQHPNVVALQSREANTEGEGEIGLAELVRWSLRMSPDRVIVGEVRGAEVLPMLNAMSMGTDGSMCTLHASSSRGAFARLASYAIQAPERLSMEATNLLVAGAIDLVVFLSQDAAGRRFVSSVREVLDAEDRLVSSNEVFRPGPDGRAVPGAPLRGETADRLEAAGLDLAVLERSGGWCK